MNFSAIKGAIFDLDGTLLDSMPLWDTVAADYLRSLGIEPKENLTEKFKTFSVEQSARYYRDNYGVKLSVGEIVKGINTFIGDFYFNKVKLKRGAAEFLERLHSKGVKMCVATVTDYGLAEAALERCGILGVFSGIVTAARVGCGKENPLIYGEALKLLGTQKSATVVFEDSLHALETAKKDGFTVAAVFDPSEENQSAMKDIADFYIEDFFKVEVI